MQKRKRLCFCLWLSFVLVGCPTPPSLPSTPKLANSRVTNRSLRRKLRIIQRKLQAQQQKKAKILLTLKALEGRHHHQQKQLALCRYHSTKTKGISWDSKALRIERIPRAPHRDRTPQSRTQRRQKRRAFYRFLYTRKRRIRKGYSPVACRTQQERLQKTGFERSSALFLMLCKNQYRLRGRYYWEVGFDKQVILHSRRWTTRKIRRFLHQFRDLIESSRRLGFVSFLFVATVDLKQQHRNMDFKNRWYGRRVRFPHEKNALTSFPR